jgi:hypothetical protein
MVSVAHGLIYAHESASLLASSWLLLFSFGAVVIIRSCRWHLRWLERSFFYFILWIALAQAWPAQMGEYSPLLKVAEVSFHEAWPPLQNLLVHIVIVMLLINRMSLRSVHSGVGAMEPTTSIDHSVAAWRKSSRSSPWFEDGQYGLSVRADLVAALGLLPPCVVFVASSTESSWFPDAAVPLTTLASSVGAALFAVLSGLMVWRWRGGKLQD